MVENYLIFDHDKYPDIIVEYKTTDWYSLETFTDVVIKSKIGDFRYVSKVKTHLPNQEDEEYKEYISEQCDENKTPLKEVVFKYEDGNEGGEYTDTVFDKDVKYNAYADDYKQLKLVAVVSKADGTGMINCGSNLEHLKLEDKDFICEECLTIKGESFPIKKDGKVYIPRKFMEKYGYLRSDGRYILLLLPKFVYNRNSFYRHGKIVEIPGIEKYLDSIENKYIIWITKNLDITNLKLGRGWYKINPVIEGYDHKTDRRGKHSIWHDEENGEVPEDCD